MQMAVISLMLIYHPDNHWIQNQSAAYATFRTMLNLTMATRTFI